MSKELYSLATGIVHLPLIVLLIWLAYRRFWQHRPASQSFASPFAAFRVLALFGLAAMLAGCANSDPLAVASGPVFQLNSGHWQPSKQAMAAAPVVAAD